MEHVYNMRHIILNFPKGIYHISVELPLR